MNHFVAFAFVFSVCRSNRVAGVDKRMLTTSASKMEAMAVVWAAVFVAFGLTVFGAGADMIAGKTSAAACGAWCGTNNDCDGSLLCSRCATDEATCVRGNPCGTSCNVTTDCDQASNCTQCIEGVCVSGCGQACNATRDCLRFHCNQCLYGQCVLWHCNQYCTSDEPCTVGNFPGCGTCDHDAPNAPGVCRSTCGAACNGDMDCPSRCPFCVGGTCTVTRDP